MRSAVLALIAIMAVARPAAAHQTSVKYVDLAVDGGQIAVTFRVAPGDVTEPMGLPADAKPTAAEAARAPAVAPFVARWLAIATASTPCPASAPSARPDDDGKFVVITWAATCSGSTDELRLDFAAFFAIDPRHIAIVRLEATGAEPVDAIVRAGESPLVLRAGRAPPSLVAWIRAGMDHIYDGRDHIAFVLALLLVVMLVRESGRWQVRKLGETLRATAGVITAFTIAHSLSLIAASLGWVHLPGRFVESVIALSIAYTAVEDIVKPDVRWRFALTFGFGLVHGLGFASVLAELLPPHDVIVPLLCFNLGVELGQLTIVLVVLPVLYVVARKLGAEAYRRGLMPFLAGLICLLGVNWLLGRAFGVVVIPWTALFGM